MDASIVAQGFFTEQPSEIVPRADVVSWEDMEASQSAKQRVLGAPSADAVDLGQYLNDLLVVEGLE